MYYAHFGLVRPPFRITPDPALFFSGADRGAVLEALAYVVLSGEGITKVVGEVGSGKTMLCRMLEEKLPDNVETIYIANPNISPENILNAIAFEAGLNAQSDNKMELMQQFQSWLVQCHANNKRVVVLIEEAQGMPVATLEELRLLSNLETDESKLMQIVLFGQPELDETLGRPEIRQLQDRIAHNFYLSPLTARQTQDYLNFRVRQAGYHGPDLFDQIVSRVMLRASKGLIRRINILADKTLLVAFSAGTARISKAHVKTAINDSKFTNSYRRFPLWQTLGGGIALGVLVAGLSAWIFWPSPQFETATSQLKTSAGVNPRLLSKSSDILMQASNNKAVESANNVKDQKITAEKELSDKGLIAELSQDIDTTTMLKRRIFATQRWLVETNDKGYSIQLMMIKESSAKNLNRYLEGISNSIDLDDIFVYETELGEGPMLGVLYQRFETRTEALARMKNMPATFENIEPFLLRSVRGLHSEIADNARIDTYAENNWNERPN